VNAKYNKLWSEKDLDRLRALVVLPRSGTSVILEHSLKQIRKKARELGVPFQSEAELKTKRRQIFQNSIDGPRSRISARVSDDG
jgi:hypothetical protein